MLRMTVITRNGPLQCNRVIFKNILKCKIRENPHGCGRTSVVKKNASDSRSFNRSGATVSVKTEVAA